ncbi:phosphatidylserine decarboxylase [Herbivorax sp. ANBcel31]|uniref:phosphatidylserine decarboxylase n=1 Tax=Herbivorax sp. ANBcel31 TaxID=3069754 RepID=UPI0027B2C9C9|nr:phosphatidylserine decarboxylase [Herbivorax sp. ANBcel31]MDQ2084822.1 phosphatidylserine decarboxylase [Herbivorax sp. ANBcel31]
MIKIYNRQTKEYDIEKVAGEKFMKVLYNTTCGKAGLELMLKRKLYSVLAGKLCDSRVSALKIKKFIKKYSVDMSEFCDEPEDFRTFNEFFTRKVKSHARPFSKNPEFFLSPGDGRIRGWMNIDINKNIEIKGISYTFKELISSDEIIDNYNGGTAIVLRLNPTDYHRFHFIDDGICSKSKRIKGHYYSVNPMALLSYPKVFCQNIREYSVLKSKNYKELIYVEVGATCVGSIVQTYKPGEFIKRGSEKGFFKFGGSTVIILIKKDCVRLDEDILHQTKLGYETKIKAGEIIGKNKL